MKLKRRLFVAVSIASLAAAAFAQSSAPRAELPTVKVGDRWKYDQNDRRTGVKENEWNRTVMAVSASQIEGTENDGKFVWTSDMNTVESSVAVITGDARFLKFPLEVGKKWDFKYNFVSKVGPGKGRWQLDAVIVAYEKVKVPAGEFDAFKIEYKGFWNNDNNGRNGRLTQTTWYAPAARAAVKVEFEDGFNNWVRQLVELQLQP